MTSEAMLIIHKDNGLADPFAKVYVNHVRKDCRASIVLTQYTRGQRPPNYPVPSLLGNPVDGAVSMDCSAVIWNAANDPWNDNEECPKSIFHPRLEFPDV